MGGLEVLVNLLETKDIKCQLGSLGVLSQMGNCSETRRYLVDLGIISPLIELLKHPAKDIRILTAETMASIAMMRKARKQIRIRSGIALIVKQHYKIYSLIYILLYSDVYCVNYCSWMLWIFQRVY